LDLPQADRVAFRETTEIGAYRVLVNGVQGPRFAFVVNAPSGESDLVPDELPDVATGFDRPGGVTLRGLEEPLTPWLLTLALGLLFADVWLRQVRRR